MESFDLSSKFTQTQCEVSMTSNQFMQNFYRDMCCVMPPAFWVVSQVVNVHFNQLNLFWKRKSITCLLLFQIHSDILCSKQWTTYVLGKIATLQLLHCPIKSNLLLFQ